MGNTGAMAGLFEGVRVLEFGLFAAGPWAGELFAHGGADVVKVEPVTGDATRFNSTIVPGEGRQYIIKARGKRGLPLNLGHPQGEAIARRLALRSDVVLSNMRQGVLERHGLDYASLSAENPRIIVAELSAYGRKGPLGDAGGADFQAGAASGFMFSSANFDREEAQLIDAYASDFMAGTLLAFGISSALWRRERTGRGQHVTTSLFQAGLALQHATANVFDAVDGWKREFADWMRRERPHPREASQHRREQFALMMGGLYETADGRWITLGSTPAAAIRLLELMGVEDPMSSEPDWEPPDDPRAHFASMRGRLREAVKGRESEELVAELQAGGVPCSLLESLEEALLGEQARANGFVYEADHPAVGPMTISQAPVQFSADRYEAGVESPAFGQHLREILGELGYTDAEVDELIASGAVAEELA